MKRKKNIVKIIGILEEREVSDEEFNEILKMEKGSVVVRFERGKRIAVLIPADISKKTEGCGLMDALSLLEDLANEGIEIAREVLEKAKALKEAIEKIKSIEDPSSLIDW